MKISLQVTIANNGGDVAIIRKPLDTVQPAKDLEKL